MQTEQIIALATEHAGDNPRTTFNARWALIDAELFHRRGMEEPARRWALKSLQFSVGESSEIYQRAAE